MEMLMQFKLLKKEKLYFIKIYHKQALIKKKDGTAANSAGAVIGAAIRFNYNPYYMWDKLTKTYGVIIPYFY